MSVDSKEKYTDWYFYAFLNFISHLQWAKGEKKKLVLHPGSLRRTTMQRIITRPHIFTLYTTFHSCKTSVVHL